MSRLLRMLSFALAVSAGFGAATASAQDAGDAPASPPAQTPPAGGPDRTPQSGTAPAAGQTAPSTPAPSDQRGRVNDDDEFIPSEEIPADEEVTFPVDI